MNIDPQATIDYLNQENDELSLDLARVEARNSELQKQAETLATGVLGLADKIATFEESERLYVTGLKAIQNTINDGGGPDVVLDIIELTALKVLGLVP